MLVYEAKLVKNIEAGKNRAAKACQWTQTCTAWTAADRFVYDFVTLIKPTPTDIQRLAFLARFMNLFWHGTGKLPTFQIFYANKKDKQYNRGGNALKHRIKREPFD